MSAARSLRAVVARRSPAALPRGVWVVFLGAVASVLPSNPRAQELARSEEPVVISLSDAVVRTLAHSPRMQATEALEQAAHAAAQRARGRRFPVVELAAGYTRSSDVPELSIDLPAGSRTIFPNLPDAEYARLALSLPLWSGGQIGAEIRSSDRAREATRSESRASRSAMTLEVTIAYWSLAAARAEENVLSRALAVFDIHVRDEENRAALGVAAANDVLAVRVERDQAELERLVARHEAAVLERNLARLIGASESSPIVLADSLGATASELEHTLDPAELPPRAEIVAAEARVEAAEWHARAERAARLPQLRLSGSFEYANPNRRYLPLIADWNDSWETGLMLTWRLYDGGQIAAAAAEARAKAALARHDRERIEDEIHLELEERRLERETAQATLRVTQRRMEAAEEAVRVARDRYLQGLVSNAELLDAEVTVLEAGLHRARSIANLRIARARWIHAAGL
jgi:outer membrane protein TolC